MFIPSGLVLEGFELFLLVFVRMTGLFVVAPVFGRRNIPAYLKIGFSFFVALILVNSTAVQGIQLDDNLLAYALLIVKEFMVGLTIGFIAYIAITAIYIAGEIIDMQIGFGVVNVMDPISNIQIPVTSNLYFIICMLLLLLMNGHHMLIKTLFDSFTKLPPGRAVFTPAAADDLIAAFGTVFTTGFKIAAPVAAAILITDVALGTVSRMVPQLNIFVIGMPLKIFIGLVVLMVTIPMFANAMESLFRNMDSDMQKYIKDLLP